MTRIATLNITGKNKKTDAILREIEETFGMIPNLFATYAHHPALLEVNWNKVKAIMLEGVLERKVKETIAVLVSKDNSCKYCVAAHTMALKMIGVSDEEIRLLEKDLDAADFTDKERHLITFARNANNAPIRITDDEFRLLKETGANEKEIIEALGVMELFVSFNKFLDSLQVNIDF